jgi:MoxR-like ATPase
LESKERLHYPAEYKFLKELQALAAHDRKHPRPRGWVLSPRSVLAFIVGGDSLPHPDGTTIALQPKFHGPPELVEAAIATLASDRALLLAGPPGTAKSMLSEWLSAAICGTSRLIVQGNAGVTEDQVRYSWNYALLLKDGPTAASLKPSPIMQAMQDGRIARIEELTRCVSEVQDALISILSEKEVAVTEMDNRVLMARPGFNVIATANTADKGIHDMSSALKRRFNFVNIPPVQDLATELRLVRRRAGELMADNALTASVPDNLLKILVTIFNELRTGKTIDGQAQVPQPSGDVSCAQAISTLFDSCVRAAYFGETCVTADHLASSIGFTLARDGVSDAKQLLNYLAMIDGRRAGAQAEWRQVIQSLKKVLGTVGAK